MRGGTPGQNHVLRNLLPHHRHWFNAIAFTGLRSWNGLRPGSARHWSLSSAGSDWSWGRRRFSRRWSAGAGFDEAEDVVLGNASAHAGAFEPADINAVFLGNFANQRARFAAA